jgi:hypothetical protein
MVLISERNKNAIAVDLTGGDDVGRYQQFWFILWNYFRIFTIFVTTLWANTMIFVKYIRAIASIFVHPRDYKKGRSFFKWDQLNYPPVCVVR